MFNTNNQQPNFNNTNEKSSPIVKAIQILDDIQQPIKNKYVTIDDLATYIEKTEKILKLAKESMDFLLTNTQPSLDVIFPAMDHLKLFLSDVDRGAIALVSKNLYNLMISHFGESNVDIFIAKHYIDNDAYDYSVDVNYNTMVPRDINKNNYIQKYGGLSHSLHCVVDVYIKGKFPLKVKTIARKRLRKLIGQELYFSEHKIVFSKEDIMYLYLKYNELIPYNSKVCIFCYNFDCNHRRYCYVEFVRKERKNIIFNDHIKNGTHGKEFKYFLHDDDRFGKKNCRFCSNHNDESCTIIYQDIKDDDYDLKDKYEDLFNTYHSQIKYKAISASMYSVGMVFMEREREKNYEEMKSYSFCIHPEYEYIYGQSEILNK